MQQRLYNGVRAGITAAAASGVIAIIATQTGWSQEFNPPMLLDRLTGLHPGVVVGWTAHFVVYGVGLGLLFGALGRKLSDLGYGLSGLFFGLLTYGAVAFVFLPLVGAGIGGINIGYATVPVLLIAHLVFGVTLGSVYGRLAGPDRDALITA